MKLLYINGAARWYFDTDGNVYSDACFNDNVWKRYRDCCDQFTAILRYSGDLHTKEEALGKYNIYDTNKMRYVCAPDLYKPLKNVINPSIYKKIYEVLEEEICKADRVIIRSASKYTSIALEYLRKYRKPYLVEVTACVWTTSWYHSLKGKLVAPIRELSWKRIVQSSPWALYVTQDYLQKIYPCKGKTLGCSDVFCMAPDDKIWSTRIARIHEIEKKKIVIGTAAAVDLPYKGQSTVIRALAELKKRGIDCFEYQMIGAGNAVKLMNLAKKLGVFEMIKPIGLISHDKVSEWLQNVDIYVQPSLTEGLSRSIVEAMSQACPIVSSDVGGNSELTAPENLFSKRDYKRLAIILEKLIDPNSQEKGAWYSYQKCAEYAQETLDAKRTIFLNQFMGE